MCNQGSYSWGSDLAKSLGSQTAKHDIRSAHRFGQGWDGIHTIRSHIPKSLGNSTGRSRIAVLERYT
jgi:hypothetical protein